MLSQVPSPVRGPCQAGGCVLMGSRETGPGSQAGASVPTLEPRGLREPGRGSLSPDPFPAVITALQGLH